jgi:hypothetical protein
MWPIVQEDPLIRVSVTLSSKCFVTKSGSVDWAISPVAYRNPSSIYKLFLVHISCFHKLCLVVMVVSTSYAL